MAELTLSAASLTVRAMGLRDLPAYKSLRDAMLAAHPESFTSDAATERARSAESYAERLGLDGVDRGRFLLGAWRSGRLFGAIGCERDERPKVRHIVRVVGLMVVADGRRMGVGRALLARCRERAAGVEGVEMVTLSVTACNRAALALYESAGFTMCGTLQRAIRLQDGTTFDKCHMVLVL